MAGTSDFEAVPVLDYSLANSPATKPTFLDQLRHVLVNVGFLYLSNHPVAQSDIDLLIDYIPKLFALPQEAKDEIKMLNSPHFLGYSRCGSELTKGTVDQREQFDFGTKHICQWKPGAPEYYHLWGPCQWPNEDLIPGFREVYEHILDQLQDLSYAFSSLIAEALGLDPDAFLQFYESPGLVQHRSKIIRYPSVAGSNDQGVGPHFDGGFLTFLIQATSHRGLQVQNQAGQWIEAVPIPGTFVINFGKGIEFVTQGLARATSHRVLSPRGNSPRYSVAFFQNIGLDLVLTDHVLQFPPEIMALREARGELVASESVNYQHYGRAPFGQISLIGRVKSHPDVAEQHYPEVFKEVFPNGHSSFN